MPFHFNTFMRLSLSHLSFFGTGLLDGLFRCGDGVGNGVRYDSISGVRYDSVGVGDGSRVRPSVDDEVVVVSRKRVFKNSLNRNGFLSKSIIQV